LASETVLLENEKRDKPPKWTLLLIAVGACLIFAVLISTIIGPKPDACEDAMEVQLVREGFKQGVFAGAFLSMAMWILVEPLLARLDALSGIDGDDEEDA
jgi:hypothetical protein